MSDAHVLARRSFLRGAAGAAAAAVVPSLTLGPAGAACAAGGAGPARAAGRGRFVHMAARPAEELAGSVGVVNHFHFGRSVYGQTDRVVEAIGDLGVRHVRNRIATTRGTREGFTALARMGVQVHGVCGAYGDPQTMHQVMREVVSSYRDPLATFSAFEGINEPNNNGRRAWVEETRAKARDLFEERAAFGLDPVPIVGPALARVVSGGAEGSSTGPQSRSLGSLEQYIDYGNIHVYPRALPPSADIDEFMRYQRDVCGDLPMFCTEGGYFNAMRYRGGAFPTPASVAGKYLPQQIMEHWIRGNPRFFTYELLDDVDPRRRDREAHFGLLAVDGPRRRDRWRPKPTYDALKNFVAILGDPGPAHGVGGMRLAVDGPHDLRTSLVAKRNGARYLLLWRDQKCYEPLTRRKMSVDARNVTVSLPDRRRVKVFHPSQSSTGHRIGDRVSSVRVAVGDELVICKIV